jgi:exosome complex protein LRP1
MDPSVTASLQQLTVSIDLVRDKLAPFMDLPTIEWNKLDTIERCSMCVLMAYTLNSLYFAYLKAQGVSPLEHPIMQELERVKTYMDKIKQHSKRTRLLSLLRV